MGFATSSEMTRNCLYQRMGSITQRLPGCDLDLALRFPPESTIESVSKGVYHLGIYAAPRRPLR